MVDHPDMYRYTYLESCLIPVTVKKRDFHIGIPQKVHKANCFFWELAIGGLSGMICMYLFFTCPTFLLSLQLLFLVLLVGCLVPFCVLQFVLFGGLPCHCVLQFVLFGGLPRAILRAPVRAFWWVASCHFACSSLREQLGRALAQAAKNGALQGGLWLNFAISLVLIFVLCLVLTVTANRLEPTPTINPSTMVKCWPSSQGMFFFFLPLKGHVSVGWDMGPYNFGDIYPFRLLEVHFQVDLHLIFPPFRLTTEVFPVTPKLLLFLFFSFRHKRHNIMIEFVSKIFRHHSLNS